MFAISLDGRVLPWRFHNWDAAVEYAQEDAALPAWADWHILAITKRGNWCRVDNP